VVTTAATTVVSSPGNRGGLMRSLMAVVRPQFRADDPVFGGGACLVGSCSRPARGRGLCPGHLLRWADEGRPDIAEFAASTDPRWRRERPNQRCEVAGCGYGSARGGLCQLHAQRWQRAGRPDRDRWLARPPSVQQPAPGASCRIEHCTLWPQAALAFCHSHANTWKVNGRPDADEFARRFTASAPTADETIRLDQLDAQVKLEMQYVLQTRHDERRGKLTPGVVMRVVRLLAAAPVVGTSTGRSDQPANPDEMISMAAPNPITVRCRRGTGRRQDTMRTPAKIDLAPEPSPHHQLRARRT
jgi:hypothetical protein